MLLMFLIGWLPWLLLGSAALLLGFRAVRAFERRGTANAELTALRDRIQLIEDTLAEQGESVRRIADGQEFTQRLLLQRTVAGEKSATSAPENAG